MERKTFLMKINPDRREAVLQGISELAPRILEEAERLGVGNFSVWSVSDILCGYGEYARDTDLDAAPELRELLERVIDGSAELLCPTGSMRLMYHDIGIVRADKSLIRHRVFVTKLKPGCAEEYKRRHDGLIAARGDAVSEGPDSNFTIWYGAGYIFGYCEKVKAFDREMTEQEKQDTIAWETRQLEIMDWLTDDVDWITGESHEHIRRIV
ncbi:MAG: L-rhamnose mutarotase [Clostridia bacterium]|nr:L-rhamnose mutarotase [Clostridia bacterium]